MSPSVPYQKDIENSLAVLRAGGVLLYPTDTIWGLGCDPENPEALERLFEIKNRPANKTLLLLAGSLEQIKTCVESLPDGLSEVLMGEGRPVTVIYTGARNAAKLLAAPDGTIGMRLSSDDFCRDLAKAYGKPIVSTSANLSGEIFSGSFSDVHPEIREKVDYTVVWRREDAIEARPSRIVKAGPSGGWTILRD